VVPPVGPAGDTYYNTGDGREYISNGTSWLPLVGLPAGGTQDQLLAKNSSTDYDTGWASAIGANGGITSAAATGSNTFGAMDVRRNNGGSAVAALQGVGVFRALSWDGVSAYQVNAAINFGASETVSPTKSGGNVQFSTVGAGTTSNTARLRVESDGTIRMAYPCQIGQASLLTAPNTGTVLDLSNGLLATRRQAVTLVNGANNNLPLPTSSFVEFTGPTAAFTLTGIAGGVDGAIINFVYWGAQQFTIWNGVTSTTTNQIVFANAADQVTSNGQCAGTLIYDTSIGGGRWILVDYLAHPMPGEVVWDRAQSVVGAWGSLAQSTYAYISAVGTLPIVKRSTSTLLEFSFGCSAFVNAAGVVTIGWSPTNSSADIITAGQFFFNAVSTHQHWTGVASVGGRTQGAYTGSWWVKTTGTGQTMTSDTNDLFWGRVREVWP
jgi:hypothetical protein